jgi:putative transposase
MPRHPRIAPGGYVYHAINRGAARRSLFKKAADYAAFERVLHQAMQQHPIRLLGYCLMPKHWHFVLWPERDGELTAFLRWLTHTHTQRWHAHYHSAGTGHLYQGRYRAFPIEEDDHLLTVLRYVERNPLCAGLVQRAEAWRWSSLWRRQHAAPDAPWQLHPSPLALPNDWAERVHKPETAAELEAVRRAIARDQPFGNEGWQRRIASRLGLEFTFRARGRPRKRPATAATEKRGTGH